MVLLLQGRMMGRSGLERREMPSDHTPLLP